MQLDLTASHGQYGEKFRLGNVEKKIIWIRHKPVELLHERQPMELLPGIPHGPRRAAGEGRRRGCSGGGEAEQFPTVRALCRDDIGDWGGIGSQD